MSQQKSFVMACTALEELGINEPHKLSLYDFIAKSEYYEARHKPNN